MVEQKVEPGPYIGPMLQATMWLVNALKDGKAGDTLTDEALSGCGRNCYSEEGRRCVRSAINHVSNNYGVVWRRIRQASAIKCLGPSERVEVVRGTRRHVSKVTKKAVRILATVQSDDLNATERPAVMALAAQMGTLALCSSTSTQRALESRGVSKPLEPTQLLEVFKK